ncbi:MAG TPA: glycosyltransferase [Chlamydiales bacterium]|nr:glycosyltransferase [Chlamydiales bacterium]
MKLALFLLLVSIQLYAQPRVCLNMIVKDESPVIERCLNSVKAFIDYWVIVDTGSTDGTQQIIRRVLRDIPGELHQQPWENFEHNRNEALALARSKAEYIMIIDADEKLMIPPNATFPPLQLDAYLVRVLAQNYDTPKIFLFKTLLPWKWEGVLHEHLTCEGMKAVASYIRGIEIKGDTLDGCRSRDPHKYEKDAAILEKALRKEPNNARYWIFLGESYYLIKKYEAAIDAYEQRVSLGGWEEEVYHALHKIAACKYNLKRPPKEMIDAYNRAFNYRPTRGEPLFYMASYYYHELHNPKQAYEFLKQFVSIPIPSHEIQVEFPLYHYLGSALLAECAVKLQKFEEAKKIAQELLLRNDLPPEIRQQLSPKLCLLP